MCQFKPYACQMSFFSTNFPNNITCDKDVDEMHPAGSSLNDLFLFLTFSPDKYLKNGYKPLNIDQEKELEKVGRRFRNTVNAIFNSGTSSELVYGTLSEINFSHYKLVRNYRMSKSYLCPV